MILIVLAETPASAHSEVEFSDPADGAVVDHPVSEVTLVFTDQGYPIGDGFFVIEADGQIRLANEWVSTDDRRFVVYFDPPITGGRFGLQWAIRSKDDSHSMMGVFTFTVDAEEQAVAIPADDTLLEAAGSAGSDAATVDPPPEATAANDVVDPGIEAETQPKAVDQSGDTAEPATLESIAVADPEISLVAIELDGSAGMRTLGLLGRLSSILGSIVAVGALVFLLRVLRGTVGEGRLVVLIARRAALLLVAGAVARSVAQVAVVGGGWASVLSPAGWSDVLASRFGGAIALDLIGAFGVSTGSHFRREPIGHQSNEAVRAGMARVGVLAAGPRSPEVSHHPPVETGDESGATLSPPLFRWHPTSASLGAMLGVVALLAAAVLDGHTLGESQPVLSAVVTSAHFVAGSVWVGGVIVLLCLLHRRFGANRRVEAVDLAVRYSVLASLSLAGVALAGLILTYTHVDSISEVWTTGWGQLVLAKLALVAVAASLGAVNHFVVVPRLVTRTDDIGLGILLKRLISAEIVVLVAVVSVTAQLVATGL